ncbi:alpha/beta fold hydrolase [Sedimentitalea todarodis]|uniref:Alpha/beta fold hydrolase n=1 Tax=Sedimentitalea todarodis TaxID=1631240 RepID=A0ABU3V8F1_9RHOB|nr:alpha/beta fold hydrolase [Sedimentitalea todarodis]MDU9002434.1 alpha/beta fold hydrolase [Sedimentitalea todarodis]
MTRNQHSDPERRLAAILAADMVGFARLMELEESALLARQKRHRAELINPQIAARRGRMVKTSGDGMLVEFASASDAVRCAIDIQSGMIRREVNCKPDRRIQYRIGINIGDVIPDDGDIFGDGVNVAARLEQLAEPGGVCISDIVHQTVTDGIGEPFRNLGRQRVKNITRPIRVWQWTADPPDLPEAPALSHQQHVRFCTSADGTQIAWASVGNGPTVLRAPHWINHIEYEWQNPLYGPFIDRFAQATTFVRFDQRGNGLSDRKVSEVSCDAIRQDMEAVVDASGLHKFVLVAKSQGAGFAVDYAIAHPDKVSAIVFLGGYLRGALRRNSREQEVLSETGRRMIKDGWGSPNPTFRQFFTSGFVPDSGPDIQETFDEMHRLATDKEDVLRIYDLISQFDFVELARQLDLPVLVAHVRGDRRAPLDEGRLIARTIPGARFIELPGNNHVLTEGTPAFDLFFEHAIPFVHQHG